MSERKSSYFLLLCFLIGYAACGPALAVSIDDSGVEDGQQGAVAGAVAESADDDANGTTAGEVSSGRADEDAVPLEPEETGEPASDFAPRVNAFEADLISGLARKEEDLRKARAEIERLRDIIKRIAEANRRELTVMRYNLGCLWRKVGEPRRAEEEFLKALKLTPDDAATHYNLGILYQEDIKDFERARRHYERFLELNPHDRDAAQVRSWLMELSR